MGLLVQLYISKTMGDDDDGDRVRYPSKGKKRSGPAINVKKTTGSKWSNLYLVTQILLSLKGGEQDVFSQISCPTGYIYRSRRGM